MTAPSPQPAALDRPRFRPDIEGLRAVAILLVVAYHAGVPGFTGGYIGVDVFFVVSGYLITWLLVAEAEQKGRVDFLRFYARRARRLLPASALMLVATVVASAFVYAPFEQLRISSAAFATAAYASNIYFSYRSTDYLADAPDVSPLLHTWSLSVEEQFYLVWPLFVVVALGVLLGRGAAPQRRRLLLWMGVVTVGVFVLSAYVTTIRQHWAFFLSPLRAWEFSAGALGLLLPRAFWRRDRAAALPGQGAEWLGWAGLTVVVASAVAFDSRTAFPGVAALAPVLGTVWMLRAGVSGGALARVLSVRPMQEIGRLSYSWYLWHWPILILAGALYPEMGVAARLALVGLALVISEASYRLVEDPVRHAAWLRERHGRSIALGVLLTIVGVGTAVGWRSFAFSAIERPVQREITETRGTLPEVFAMGCETAAFKTTLDECSFGDDSAERTAVMFGDSHISHWSTPLRDTYVDNGWRIINLTKSACPALTISFFYDRIGRPFTECQEWQQRALARMEEIQPDLILTSHAYDYPYTEEEWTRGTAEMTDRLAALADTVVVIRDTPRPGFDVPTCLAREDWRPGFLPRASCEYTPDTPGFRIPWAAQTAAAAAHPNVLPLDFAEAICDEPTCGVRRDGMTLFRDDGHISEQFAQELIDTVRDRLRELDVL